MNENQKKAIERYEKKTKELVEQFKVRLPKGSQAYVSEYVAKKAEEFPKNPKYSTFTGKYWKPSATALVRALLEEEMGISLDDLTDTED